MNYKLDTVVRFFISTGIHNSDSQEDFTLLELGFDQTELDENTDDYIEDQINKCFDDWLQNYDIGWSVVE